MAEAMLKQFFDQDLLLKGPDYEDEEAVPIDGFPENSRVPCDDVVINQSFPRQPLDSKLIKSIEYRVKLLSARKVIIQPGETITLQTNTVVNRKPGQLSLLIKPPENLTSIFFLSDGKMNPQYRGRLSVTVQNASNNLIHINAHTLVGYLILTPFLE